MIYYVIQNIDTGEYWRAKGNHWGKYFNQAVIYRVKKTAEHILDELADGYHSYKVKLVAIKIVAIESKENINE